MSSNAPRPLHNSNIPCQSSLLSLSLPSLENGGCWQTPHKHPSLKQNQIHIWRASTQLADRPSFSKLTTHLDLVEQNRAARFYRKVDCTRFTLGRGLLRHLLSAYVGIPAEALRFRYGPQGKPELIPEHNPIGLCFNLSHSGNQLLYAVTLYQTVGVDIEHLREVQHSEQIARRFFSRRETEALLALSQRDRQLGFFAIWTRKEAFIKARGDGLSFPLDRFEVVNRRQIILLNAAGKQEEEGGWSWYTLYPRVGYTAALVVDQQGFELCCWDVERIL